MFNNLNTCRIERFQHGGLTDNTIAVSRVGQRRQVVIPKAICDALGLEKRDIAEVRAARGLVSMRPRKHLDADNVLTPVEETKVRRGEAQLKRGEAKLWRVIKDALAR